MNICFCALLIASSMISCSDEFEDNNPPIKIIYEILNKDGIPSTTFYEGEELIFSISIINYLNDDIILSRTGIDQVDIFRVFGIIKDDSGNSIIQDFGKPYGVLFCNKSLGAVIPANDTLKLEIPWSPVLASNWNINFPYYNLHFCEVTDKDQLKRGKYWSSVKTSIEYFHLGTRHKTDTVNYRIDFEII